IAAVPVQIAAGDDIAAGHGLAARPIAVEQGGEAAAGGEIPAEVAPFQGAAGAEADGGDGDASNGDDGELMDHFSSPVRAKRWRNRTGGNAAAHSGSIAWR